MSKKEKFIKCVEQLMADLNKEDYKDEFEYLDNLKNNTTSTVKPFTENGRKILQWMQSEENNYSNLFTAKDIGEGLFISARSAASSMRKLRTDGYVEAIKNSGTTTYQLTVLGRQVELTN